MIGPSDEQIDRAPTMLHVIEWTKANGVVPLVRIDTKTTTTGTYSSNDERGKRCSGYHRYTVSAVDYDTVLASFDAGTVDMEDSKSKTALSRAVVEPCWQILCPGRDLPDVPTARSLIGPAEFLRPHKSPENTIRSEIFLIEGPLGRYVEAQWTYPQSAFARMQPNLFGKPHTTRVTRAGLRPSNAVEGAWLVMHGEPTLFGRYPIARVSAEDAARLFVEFTYSGSI